MFHKRDLDMLCRSRKEIPVLKPDEYSKLHAGHLQTAHLISQICVYAHPILGQKTNGQLPEHPSF